MPENVTTTPLATMDDLRRLNERLQPVDWKAEAAVWGEEARHWAEAGCWATDVAEDVCRAGGPCACDCPCC